MPRDSVDDDGFTTVHVELNNTAGKSKSSSDTSSIRESVDDDGFTTVHARSSENAAKKSSTDNKNAQNSLAPDVGRAWAFFDAQLPHRLADELQPSGYRLCLPGETRGADGEPAEKYSLCSNNKQIYEFGTGVALYFRTLKLMLALFAVIAGASILAMNQNKKFNPEGTPRGLVGSAYGATSDSLTVGGQGAYDLIVVALLTLILIASGYLQKNTAKKIDRNHLTPSDYSIQIENPPKNVSDPVEYQKFFSKYGDVVLVSIALNNGELVTNLTEKKTYESIEVAQKNYKALAEKTKQYYQEQEHLTTFQKFMQPYGLYQTVTFAENRLTEINKTLFSLSQKDYHPWRVYVTFSSQKSQMRCLHRTSLSYAQLISGAAKGSEADFNGCLLNISRAPEPTDILFENSNYTKAHRWALLLASYTLCAGVMAIAYLIVQVLATKSSSLVALFISCINVILPQLALYTTFYVEAHVQRSDMEMSTLLKLVVVRCVNSGVLIYLTVSENSRFSEEHLAHVQSILIADAVTTPVFRLLDISGLINRYVFSRGVGTQEELNVLFTPTAWTLAERYTDMLKTIFCGLFFAVPMPSGLIITACAMFSTFCVDKYSLLRLWRRPPALDDSLATTSRVFLAMTVFAHITVSTNYFAHWPFNDDSIAMSTCDFFTCTTGNLTGDQKTLTTIYNVMTIGYFAVFIAVVVIGGGGKWLISLFSENASNTDLGSVLDVESDMSFRELGNQSAYVPVLEPELMSDPIIFSDISNLPTKFLPIQRSNMFSDAVDPVSFSVANQRELPSCDETQVKSLFTQVMYFEAKGATFVPYNRPTFITANNNVPGLPAQQQHLLASQEALPAAWEERKTPAGKVYYANKLTKTTTWTRPV
jgi:hypothetical protein